MGGVWKNPSEDEEGLIVRFAMYSAGDRQML